MIHENLKHDQKRVLQMGIASLTNWLIDSIEDGHQPASLYIAELAKFPDFLILGFYQIDQPEHSKHDRQIKRIRYETHNDPQLSADLPTIPLKDCWLVEQFLLYQLNDYKKIIPELQEAEWPGFQETLHVPALGREHFIEWIVKSIQLIMINKVEGYKTCLDSLITTSRQRELYFKQQRLWNAAAKSPQSR